VFLKIIKCEFTPDHPLRKIFNKNNLKLSYSCMPNVQQIINRHNQSILNPKETTPKGCNCRVKSQCPMEGRCLESNIVYQATVSTDNKSETYVGLTSTTFKARYNNHKYSFNHTSKRAATELSNYIWSLKDNNIPYNIKWSILKHANPYNTRSKLCSLCNWEKYFIICEHDKASLNSRNELTSACRHISKHLLSNWIATNT
jgi:hypothetical protein